MLKLGLLNRRNCKLYNILITDAESRKTLSVIRALGKMKNCRVFAVSKYNYAIGSYSKYVERRFKTDSYSERQLVALVEKVEADLILPCSEETVEIVSKSKILKENVISPVPSYEMFQKCRDKSLTIDLAREVGVDFPKSEYVENVDDLIRKLNSKTRNEFPVLVKPTESSGSRGLRLLKSKDALNESLVNVWSSYNGFLIQDVIPLEGDIVDAVFLYKNGKCLAAFSDVRLRTYPPKMGACTLGLSSYDEKALEIGGKLLDKLFWNGFAQVEFRLNPKDGDLYLMEINPRLWGSVQLPIFAGVNFPEIMIESFLENKDISPDELDYKTGVYFRWFGDYLSIIKNGASLTKKVGEVFKKPAGKLTNQIFDSRDLLPSLIFIMNGVRALFSPNYWRKNVKSERI